MRNRIVILVYAVWALAAPLLEAAPVKKVPSSTQKQLTKTNKPSRPTPQSALQAQKKSSKTRILAKHHKKTEQKTVAKTSVRQTVASIKRKDVMYKAIAQARRQVAVQQVSAIGSTLYVPSVQSAGALVVNERSGQIIYEKNAQLIAPIASISKIMTAMVTLDAHLPMNELLTITEADIDCLKKTSSRLPLGTQLTRAEMLLLALMSSENRAASALSRHYPGGQNAFIRTMNQKALMLGMKQTRFNDSTGLNSGNVSTLHDLSLMVAAAHQYPEIQQFSTSLQYTFVSNITGKELLFRNTNPLTHSNEWNIGVSKTGYINEAGKCLVMHATINDAPIVIILLDSVGQHTRVADAQRIKKWMERDPIAQLQAG